MDPQKLRYTTTHEWAHIDGSLCTVGLTKYAVEQLSDVIYIDLPDIGDPVAAGESFGEIESVKSVNDLNAPVTGDVVKVNDALTNDPTVISKDPYGAGWVIKIQMDKNATLNHLLSPAQYEKQIASEHH